MHAPILLVDDEPDIRESIRDLLVRRHYLVEVAEGGKTALAKLQERQFGLVLLDWNLDAPPSGALLVRMIRAIDERIPIVVLSGDSDSLVEASHTPVSEYLLKPFSFDELLLVVKTFVRPTGP